MISITTSGEDYGVEGTTDTREMSLHHVHKTSDHQPELPPAPQSEKRAELFEGNPYPCPTWAIKATLNLELSPIL